NRAVDCGSKTSISQVRHGLRELRSWNQLYQWRAADLYERLAHHHHRRRQNHFPDRTLGWYFTHHGSFVTFNPQLSAIEHTTLATLERLWNRLAAGGRSWC